MSHDGKGQADSERFPNYARHRSGRRNFLKVLGVSTAAGLAGCMGDDSGTDTAGGDTATATPVGTPGEWPDYTGETVEIFIFDDFQRPNYKAVADKFKEETGGQVKLQVSDADIQELIQRLQAGSAPDIIRSNRTTMAGFIGEGVLEPMDGFVEYFEEVWDTNLDDKFRWQQNGHDWMVPMSFLYNTNYYRTDMYEQTPDTWQKLEEEAKRVDDPDGIRGAFVPANAPGAAHNLSWDLMSWFWSNNANMVQRNGGDLEVVFDKGKNRERVIETLKFRKRIHNNYSSRATDASWGAQGQAITNEVSAQTTLLIGLVKGSAISNESPFKDAIAPTRMPYNADRHSSRPDVTTVGAQTGWIRFKGASDASLDYMKMLLQPEFYPKFSITEAPASIPPTNAVRESEIYQNRLSELDDSWTDEMIDTMFSQEAIGSTVADEVKPPNPFASQMINSGAFQDMTFRAFIEGHDIGTVVDETGQRFRNIMNENM